MASSPEHRGDSVRITWLLGGRRGGAKQSATFSGPPEARLKLALAAKQVVEARGHNMTREQCYAAILGDGDTDDGNREVPFFRDWAAEWVAQLREAGTIDPHTIAGYENKLRSRIVPYLGHLRLTEIDREVIKSWVKTLRTSRSVRRRGRKSTQFSNEVLEPRTVHSYFILGGSCLGAAVPRWIPANPAAILPNERRKNIFDLPPVRRSAGIFLAAWEVDAILEHCTPDLRDLVFTAFRTGMRRGELAALQVRDVLFNRNGGATIKVQRGLKGDGRFGEPKTESSARDIPVGTTTADILRRRTQGRRSTALVFTPPFADRWRSSTLHKYWSAAVAGARRCEVHPPPAPPKPRFGPVRGLRADEVSTCECPGVMLRRPRMHDARHTHVSALIDRGWSAKKIQVRLGHATYQMTMDVYGHLMDHGSEEEMESLEGFFAPKAPPVLRGGGSTGLRRGLARSVRQRVVRRSAPGRR